MGDIQQIELIRSLSSRMQGPVLEIGSKRYGEPPISYDYRTLLPAGVPYTGIDAEPGLGVDRVVDMTADLPALKIMTTLIKQRRESVELFEKAQRTELAAKERQEITIIEAYLPQALSPQQLAAIVDSVVAESGARSLKDMGAVMKAVMTRLAGQPADGKQISDLVRAKLQ